MNKLRELSQAQGRWTPPTDYIPRIGTYVEADFSIAGGVLFNVDKQAYLSANMTFMEREELSG